MSFFEDASLVLIPSAQKLSKIYSVKPTDGTGDLTFTRSNDTATRVASNGLIEKVRTNLVTYSNTFSDASWTKIASSVTQGATDPFGGSTAWTFQSTAASGEVQLTRAITGTNTLSIYAKAGNTSILNIYIGSVVTFNLSTGLVTAGTGSMVNVGNGWYRCIVPFTSHTTFNPYFDSTAIGQNVLIAFAQQESGDIATDYIATTTAAVSVGPVANVPRLDYLNSSCPRLLLEPQRTNLVTFSEQLDNAAWTKGGTTISANTSATLDPSGYNGSDKLVEDSSTGVHRVFNNSSVVVSDSVATTYSVFAKAAERTQIYLRDNDIVGARFNLSTGAVISTEGTATATITNYGNGWYRCTITRISSNTAGRVIVYLDNGGDSYTGNGTSGVYIFGAQIESSAAYATSYIPTLGAAVTRGADAASKTGISSLIGQTEGTLFIDVNLDTVSAQTNDPVLIYLRGTNVETYIEIIDNGGISSLHFNSGVQASIDAPAGSLIAGRNKFAFTYKQNDFALYLNGVLMGTDTSGTVGAQGEFGFQYHNSAFEGQQRVNQALLFPTRLSNADLAALTA